MQDVITIFKTQYKYVAQTFERRRNEFDKSFTTALFDGEPTAEDVFRHAIVTLYKHSVRLMDPSKPLPNITLDLDDTLPLLERYLEGYRLAIDAFEKALSTLTEEQLEQKASMAPPHAQHMSVREWISYVTMHTIGHVAQALRLQALAMRHF